MASVKYGSIITEIKGKVGGTVFQSSKAGYTMKNKSRAFGDGHDANRAQDDLQRIRFSQVTKVWSTLTSIERAAWNALVGTWTFINKFGDVYNGSAYQIFCAANLNRIAIGQPILTVAPTYKAAVDPEVSFTDFSISGDFKLNHPSAAAAGEYVVFSIYYPTTSTKSVNKSKVATTAAILYAGTLPVSVKAAAVAVFGSMPELGSIIYCKVWCCFPSYPLKQYAQTFKINVVA